MSYRTIGAFRIELNLNFAIEHLKRGPKENNDLYLFD